MARIASVATGDVIVLIDNLVARVVTLPPIGENALLVASKNETPRAYIILPRINATQIIVGEVRICCSVDNSYNRLRRSKFTLHLLAAQIAVVDPLSDKKMNIFCG